MRENEFVVVCVCEGKCVCVCDCCKQQRKRGEKTTGKGRRVQEKHKALSSETADRLTGLLRPAETNTWRQTEAGERRMEGKLGEGEGGKSKTTPEEMDMEI